MFLPKFNQPLKKLNAIINFIIVFPAGIFTQ